MEVPFVARSEKIEPAIVVKIARRDAIRSKRRKQAGAPRLEATASNCNWSSGASGSLIVKGTTSASAEWRFV